MNGINNIKGPLQIFWSFHTLGQKFNPEQKLRQNLYTRSNSLCKQSVTLIPPSSDVISLMGFAPIKHTHPLSSNDHKKSEANLSWADTTDRKHHKCHWLQSSLSSFDMATWIGDCNSTTTPMISLPIVLGLGPLDINNGGNTVIVITW